MRARPRFVDLATTALALVQLVVVPGEGHGIVHPDRRSEVARRVIEWLDRWFGAAGPEEEPAGSDAPGTR